MKKRVIRGQCNRYKMPHFAICIYRGGPNWTPYYKLDASQKKEWDVYEEVIWALGDIGYVYMSGVFLEDAANEIILKSSTDYEDFSGMCRVTSRENLHSILIQNPNEYYGFLYTNQRLSDDEAYKIDSLHNGGKIVMDDEKIFKLSSKICIGIEECIDRDWFGLVCRSELESQVIMTIENIINKIGFNKNV